MKRFLPALLILLVSNVAWSAGDEHTMHARVDLSDEASLQRGATVFVNYCLGCHSASYMRYSRLAKDLHIPEEILISNMMFGTDKPGETMTSSMSRDDAAKFFSIAPPDLSVTARARGADWLYTYFVSFYRDESRPSGVNNLVLTGVSMPHVLWEKQGWQRPVMREVTNADGSTTMVIDHLEIDMPGELSEEEYSVYVTDLVNFLVYLGEPVKLERYRIGAWVILYLLVLLLVFYILKKEYWRDVH